ISHAPSKSQKDIRVTFTGLRAGDKMSEDFFSQDESTEPTVDPRLLRVKIREIPADRFDIQMEDLSRWVDERNLTGMIETLRQIVPDYRPTDLLSPATLGSSV